MASIHRTLAPILVEDKLAVISQQLILFAMIIVPFLLLSYNAAQLVPSNSFFGYTEPPSTPVAAINGRGSQEFQGEFSSARQQQQRNQSSVVMYNVSSSSANKLQAPQVQSTIFWFNVSLCLLIIAAIGIKSITKYRLVPVYSVLCFLGVLFLIAAYGYSTFPVFIRLNMKSIQWRGRSVNVNTQDNKKSIKRHEF